MIDTVILTYNSVDEVLEGFIDKFTNLNLIGIYNRYEHLNKLLERREVSLVLIDNYLVYNKYKKLRENSYSNFYSVLISDKKDNAYLAFELSINDFIYKPYHVEKLRIKLVKSIKAIEKNSFHGFLKKDYLFAKVGRDNKKIYYHDILYIEGLADYLLIYTTEEKNITLMTFDQLMEKLPTNEFIRVHRSFVVAIHKIDEFSNNKIRIGNKEIPISLTYKNEVLGIIRNTQEILN